MAATLTPTPPRPTVHRGTVGLGLGPLELEDALTAIGDREDLAGIDERARLGRVRAALERELALSLER